MRLVVPVVAVIFALGALAPPAHAQNSKAQAKKALADGDRLAKKRDFEGALGKYQEAAELDPAARTLILVAVTEEKLERYLDAIQNYEQLMERDDASDEQKQEASAKVAELEGKISVIAFNVRPVGAIVSIDDVEIGEAPLANPVRLMPGEHRYAISMKGYLIARRTFVVAPGDKLDENVQLEREVAEDDGKGSGKGTGSGSGTSGPRVAHHDQEEAGSRKVVLTGAVITSGLAVGAIITGVLALSEYNTYTDDSRPVAVREDAQSSGRTLALVTDVLIVATVGVGVYTAYRYFNQPATPAPRRARRRAKVVEDSMIVPFVTRDGGGVALSGGF